MRVEAPHPLCGTVPMVASPIRLSATPVAHDAAPPTLGQHTREVLEELAGLDAAAIDDLRRRGVV
jgi:crotonobetainyl-CoA:carnitine CoA-transferase CaiB-like acyl-CoA transferase